MCGILEFDWKYGEGDVLDEAIEYIKSTYGKHYTNENNDVQTLDVFAARGTMADTCIDNSIKYLMRYGKKNGRNKKDLQKVLHYVILALAYEEKVGNYGQAKSAYEDYTLSMTADGFEGDFTITYGSDVTTDGLNINPADFK